MTIYLGNKELKELYIGNREVKEVYKGMDLVWQSGLFSLVKEINTGLVNPKAVAVNRQGTIAVADTSTIKMYNSSYNHIKTYSQRMNEPVSLSADVKDLSDYFYVNTNDRRVAYFNNTSLQVTPTTGGEPHIAVMGSRDSDINIVNTSGGYARMRTLVGTSWNLSTNISINATRQSIIPKMIPVTNRDLIWGVNHSEPSSSYKAFIVFESSYGIPGAGEKRAVPDKYALFTDFTFSTKTNLIYIITASEVVSFDIDMNLKKVFKHNLSGTNFKINVDDDYMYITNDRVLKVLDFNFTEQTVIDGFGDIKDIVIKDRTIYVIDGRNIKVYK